jgi:hypothetical protein
MDRRYDARLVGANAATSGRATSNAIHSGSPSSDVPESVNVENITGGSMGALVARYQSRSGVIHTVRFFRTRQWPEL